MYIRGLITIGGNYHGNGLKYEFEYQCVCTVDITRTKRSVEIKYAYSEGKKCRVGDIRIKKSGSVGLP